VDHTRLAAISFDLWGTLIGSHPDFKAHRNELLRRRLAPNVSPELFTATLRAADRAADDQSMQLGHDIGFLPRVHAALERLNIGRRITSTEADEMEAEQRRTALVYPPQPLHPDLPRLLTELAAVLPLAITSNTGMLPGSLMRNLLNTQGLFESFTVQTFSNEVHFAKPHRGIFQHTLEGLRTPDPARVLHVGDNPQADIQGAAAAGMATALVTPTETAASLITAILAATEVPA
jgi:putative hydrolase of the HAD superfamily